jgi:hypothetical protein
MFTMQKKMFLAGIVATFAFQGASTTLAGSPEEGVVELTEVQFDAVTAGTAAGSASADAIAVGPLFAMALTDTTALAGASFLGDEIRGTAVSGIAISTAIAVGEGSIRLTSAETAVTNPGGNLATLSASGALDFGIMQIQYSSSVGYRKFYF